MREETRRERRGSKRGGRTEGGVGEEKHAVRNKVNKRARDEKEKGNGGRNRGV